MEKKVFDTASLREIADLLDQGLVVFSVNQQRVTYSNRIAVKILGITEDASWTELQSILPLIPTQDRLYINERYNDLHNNPVLKNVEIRLQRDPKTYHLCCNVYYQQENATIILLLNDITRSKEHENYLLEFGVRKNTLLDMLAHHLSGALNLALNLSAAAEKHPDIAGNENLKKYLRLMNENSRRCIETIHDLMKREHDQSPAISVKFARTNIAEKINYIAEEVKASNAERKFEFKCATDEIFIETDELKALQVVTNLLSNAIKFTPADKEINLTIEENLDSVVISVRDNGMGIPTHLHPFIFDPHGRAGRTGLNGEKSIGLGLFICKDLASILNGAVWFESTEGKGSTFHFSLPKQKPETNTV